jgi:hypothetical protein
LVIFGEDSGDKLVLADRATHKNTSKPISITTPGNSEIEAFI